MQMGDSVSGILFFCIVVGVIIGKLGPKASTTRRLFEELTDIIMLLVHAVMWSVMELTVSLKPIDGATCVTYRRLTPKRNRYPFE